MSVDFCSCTVLGSVKPGRPVYVGAESMVAGPVPWDICVPVFWSSACWLYIQLLLALCRSNNITSNEWRWSKLLEHCALFACSRVDRKEGNDREASEGMRRTGLFFLFFFPPLVFYCWHLPLLSIRTVPLPAGGDWRFSCRDTLEVKLHWKQNKKIGLDCGWTVQETSFQSHLAINKWTDFHQNMPGIKLLKRKIAHQRPMILKREADYAELSQLYISENVCLSI